MRSRKMASTNAHGRRCIIAVVIVTVVVVLGAVAGVLYYFLAYQA